MDDDSSMGPPSSDYPDDDQGPPKVDTPLTWQQKHEKIVRSAFIAAVLLIPFVIIPWIWDYLPASNFFWWLGASSLMPLYEAIRYFAVPDRPKMRMREVVTNEDGTKDLILRHWESHRPRRFRKKQWTVVEDKYRLADSPMVDTWLAENISFRPVQGESEIHCLTRLHWWSHGPKQIGIAALGLLLTLAIWIVPSWANLDISTSYKALAFLLVVVATAITYYVVWMQWAYTYLIVTDQRITQIYKPPFKLPGEKPPILLRNIQTSNAEDASWFGNIVGYGKVVGDTAAQEGDDWLNQGINYVRKHEEVVDLITRLTLQLVSPEETDDEAERDAMINKFLELAVPVFQHWNEQIESPDNQQE